MSDRWDEIHEHIPEAEIRAGANAITDDWFEGLPPDAVAECKRLIAAGVLMAAAMQREVGEPAGRIH